MSKKLKVSLIQSSPALFDLEASIDKIENLLIQAKKENPGMILFPEAFLPAYPRGLGFGSPVGSRSEAGRDLWHLYWQNSLDLNGSEMTKLSSMVKAAGCYVVIGVIEKDSVGKGSLYCTMLYFNPKGELLGKHRKLKPTAAERIIWAEGDGSTLSTFNTDLGKIGGLICWENYMPLARMAMYQKGVEIYLAPTADHRDSWQATMRHIACEGRCFVLGCNQFVTKEMYPKDLPGIEDLRDQPEIMSRGGSVAVDPMGNVIAGPLFDEEGILHAELDMDLVARAKMDFDPIGHYNRPDVFKFKARKQPEIKSDNF
jgi:nitrilase